MVRDQIMSSTRTKLGGLLAKPAFERARQALDPDEVGGAALLGVNGVVIVAHGRSSAYAIKQAVGQARKAVQNDIVGAIQVGKEKFS
jgi:glycerol-3-phosphate acyltransferase PlsX